MGGRTRTVATAMQVYIAMALLAIGGGIQLYLSMDGRAAALLNDLRPMGLWAYKSDGLAALCMIWGGMWIAAAVLLSLPEFRRACRMTWAELPALLRSGGRYVMATLGRDRAWLLLSAIVLLGAITRGMFMDQPIRYDEADTYLRFIDDGPLNVFYYPVPNNHVLHTLLLKVTVLLFGNGPMALRIPALFFGLLCIPAMYLLCRRMGASGIVASLCMAIWPYMLLYSTNARGYTMLVFLFILLVMLAHHVVTKPSMAGSVLMAVIAGCGMFVMPSMLFAIAGVPLWATVLLAGRGYGSRQLLSKVLVPFGIVFPLITLVLYSPVILISNGYLPIVANAHVVSQEWPVFMEHIAPHLTDTIHAFFRDVPIWVLVPIACLALLGLTGIRGQENRSLPLLLPSLLVGAATVLFQKHRIPFDRTWIFLLPVAFLLVDAGYARLTTMFNSRGRRVASLALGAVFVGWAATIVLSRPIPSYPDTGIVPEARDVVAYLRGVMKPEDRVTVVYPTNVPVHYYLRLATGRKQDDRPTAGAEYVVVDNRIHMPTHVTDRPAELLTRIGELEVYRASPVP